MRIYRRRDAMRHQSHLLLTALFLIGFAASQTASAQDPVAATPPVNEDGAPDAKTPSTETPTLDPSKPRGPDDELNRGTPMGSMHGFLSSASDGDYVRAAEYLDLRRLSPTDLASADERARQLKAVLDQSLWVELSHLSADSDGHQDDDLPAWQEHIGEIETEDDFVPVRLQRVPRETDGVLVWKVSAETVAAVPALYAVFEPVWLETVLPPFFFEFTLFQLVLWKWLALIALFAGSAFLSMMTAGALTNIVGRLALRGPGRFDPRVLLLVRGPVRLAMTIGVFGIGHRALGMAIAIAEPLMYIERTVFVVATAWLTFRLIDFTMLVIREQAVERHLEGVVPVLVPAARIAKTVIIVLASLGALGTLGVNVTAVVAGLGVGGIAVALAAQKSLEHLFGGVSLVIDQPVVVGDFFSWGDGIGIVEEIGLRSTRIRTLDRTVVTIPNAEFSNLRLENFAKRDALLMRTTIRVRLETTPDQLRALLARMRDILISHPRVTEEPARVRFMGFGDSSIDLEVFAYVDTNDWNEFLGIREHILLLFMDAITESGTHIAFPSSTTYLARDAGLDEEKQRHAEQKVSELRGGGQLPFPKMSEDQKAEIWNSTEWPPEGSAQQTGGGDDDPNI